MFKRGDLVRRIGDEENETFIVVKLNPPIIVGYNALDRPQWRRSPEHMVLKARNNPNYPGEFNVLKSEYEPADGIPRKMGRHSFL
jgi:hypothetical protein